MLSKGSITLVEYRLGVILASELTFAFFLLFFTKAYYTYLYIKIVHKNITHYNIYML